MPPAASAVDLRRLMAEAIAAYRQGRMGQAQRLAQKIVKADPRHADALRLSGLIAHAQGNGAAAVHLIEKAAASAPGDATALADLGLVHMQCGAPEKAEAALRRALAVDERHRNALSLLGGVLVASDRAPAAVAVFAKAVADNAADPALQRGLAHACLESDQFEKALEACGAALALNADDAPTLIIQGVALQKLDRLDDARRVLERAVALLPGDVSGWINLGLTQTKAGDLAAALASFDRAAKLAPDSPSTTGLYANACARNGNPDLALAACDAGLALRPASGALMAVKALALRDMGRAAEADALVGLDSLLQERAIDVPPGYENLAAFNAALVAAVLAHPTLIPAQPNRATRHGLKTGNLMHEPPRALQDFAAAVNAAVRDAVAVLRRAGHGGHAWMKAAPRQWHLTAWAVVMNDQGHQTPHFHPDAWMSGVYYAAVPADGIGEGHGEDGWIEFGQPTAQLYAAAPPPVRAIRPREGLAVLFPSYMFHRTKPFSSRAQRISLAFDVFPRS